MEREFFKQFMLCVIFPLVFEGIFPERRSIASGGLELAFQIWKKLPDGVASGAAERVVSPPGSLWNFLRNFARPAFACPQVS